MTGRRQRAPAARSVPDMYPFEKSVAQGHGGSIVVDSSGQAGTTFLIDIPVDCRPFVAG